jgi:methionine-rich copper-binding protein CopC
MITMRWVLGTVVLLTSAEAMAHAQLKASAPPEGGALAADAKTITLTFDALIKEAACTLTDASGKAAVLGNAHLEREKVHLPVAGPLSAGRYVLACKIKADAHETSHGVSFTVVPP